MEEELTTKCHSEFRISNETDIKLKVGSAIGYASIGRKEILKSELEQELKTYGLTYKDYLRHKGFWESKGLIIKVVAD